MVGMLRVRHDPTSASTVRRAISDDLAAYSIARDSCDDVVLVASELVGNAVTHVTDRTDLDVEWDFDASPAGGYVTLRVRDNSLAQPQLQDVDSSSTSGRGLAIIAAIAAEWGVHELADGKQVWARIAVRQSA